MKMLLPKLFKDAPVYSDAKREAALEAQALVAKKSNSAYKKHVYHAFNDIEFHQEVEALRKKLEKRYYKNLSFNIAGGHLFEKDMNTIQQLANNFCITASDLWTYADGWFNAGGSYGK